MNTRFGSLPRTATTRPLTVNAPAADSPSPPRGRQIVLTVLKVLALAAAFAFVSTKVDWRDSVTLADGEVLRGTIRNGFAPDTDRVIIQPVDSEEPRELAAEAWVAGSRRCGLKSALASLEALPLIGGLLAVAAMYLVHALRWWVLLRTAGLVGSALAAIRLTYVGYFSNNFMPGNAGGDVVKAVGIARLNRGARMKAVSSVFVDRIVGLLGFAILAAVAAALGSGTLGLISEVRMGLAALAVMALGALVLFWPVLASPIGTVLRKILGGKLTEKLGDWFGPYQRQPGRTLFGVALALAAHACTILAFVLFGRDLGIEAPVMIFVFAVPVTLVAAAMPISPGGWGVREASLLTVFPTVGAHAAQPSSIVLLSVLWGAANLAVSLLGGFALLVGGGAEAQALDAARAESEGGVSTS
jgi:glycosyltransferase 2 family protein